MKSKMSSLTRCLRASVKLVAADAKFADRDRQLVVVTTVTPWHEVPRIRHQVARQLTRFYNVLFVELPFGSASKRDHLKQIDDHLLVFSPVRLLRGMGRIWNNVSFIHRLYNSRVVRKINKVIHRLGYEQSLLVNFQFNFPQIMNDPVFKMRIYLCNDEFLASASTEGKRKMLWKYESEVANAADICLCVSTPLLTKLKTATESVELFLPGHEFSAGASDQQLPVDRNENNIRVCFMGYVNARVQFSWLETLLQDQSIELTLIGPVQVPEVLNELRCFDNLHTVAPLEGVKLQKAMMNHDVLIMPYDSERKSVRAATAPNKLFQYIACGKPVVISDMPAFLRLPDKFVYRASDAAQFVNAVHQAFTEDSDEATRARLKFAAENTWDARGDRLRELLDLAQTAPEVN